MKTLTDLVSAFGWRRDYRLRGAYHADSTSKDGYHPWGEESRIYEYRLN